MAARQLSCGQHQHVRALKISGQLVLLLDVCILPVCVLQDEAQKYKKVKKRKTSQLRKTPSKHRPKH
jgi:hypothetical protein